MERIRTISETHFESPILIEKHYKYQEISWEAKKLRSLGMSYRDIGEVFGVDDKTVRKACDFGTEKT